MVLPSGYRKAQVRATGKRSAMREAMNRGEYKKTRRTMITSQLAECGQPDVSGLHSQTSQDEDSQLR